MKRFVSIALLTSCAVWAQQSKETKKAPVEPDSKLVIEALKLQRDLNAEIAKFHATRQRMSELDTQLSAITAALAKGCESGAWDSAKMECAPKPEAPPVAK